LHKQKILLTGASGTVGKDVFNELLKRKDEFEISLFLRGSKKNRKLFHNVNNEVHIFWGDLRNLDEVEDAVANQNVIIHVAAVLPDIAINHPEIARQTNVKGTQNIINAMLKQKERGKIIYTSSVALYGDRLKNPIIKITDEIDIKTDDVYTQTKILSERIIIESGLEYSIFRLSYCVSTDIIKVRPLMFYMPLETSVEVIHTKDVATALVNAINCKAVWGKIFNLAGGHRCQIKFRDNLNDLMEIMGFGRNFFPDEAFAKNNFHCGYFDTAEMDENQRLLQFQNTTLEDYYAEVKKWIGFKRYLIPFLRPIIRWLLLRKSKFYQEYKREAKFNK
jgi:cholest-5-ene-3beta,7alpha-diol 3beta-dehydrogenase